MAAPHVAGVLAAVFHQKPLLTPPQVRDGILHPNSYDTISNVLASSTSSGGRLNFAKVLGNSYLNNPVPNNFPVITLGGNVFSAAGALTTLSATGLDSDNDPLRMAWGMGTSTWLLSRQLDAVFPTSSTTPFSFNAPSFSRSVTVPYTASLADGRGGGTFGRVNLTVAASSTPGGPPSGTLNVSPTDVAVGVPVTISFPVTDPEGTATFWETHFGGTTGTWLCCIAGNSTT